MVIEHCVFLVLVFVFFFENTVEVKFFLHKICEEEVQWVLGKAHSVNGDLMCGAAWDQASF